MEQARWAVHNYFNFVQKIISSYPSGGTELGEKLKSCAEQNITVAHEFVTKSLVKLRILMTSCEFKPNSCRRN